MKKMTTFLITLAMVITSIVPVFAEPQDYGLVYDHTGLLEQEYCETLAYDTLPALVEACKTDIHVDVISETGGSTLGEHANWFFTEYGYGYEGTGDGISLMLHLTEDETGLAYQGYYIIYGGENADAFEPVINHIGTAIKPWNNAEAWAGDLAADNKVFCSMMDAMTGEIEAFFLGETQTAPSTQVNERNAAYIFDEVGLLTDEEWAELEAYAKEITEEQECGVYLIAMEDYTVYGNDGIDYVAEDIYEAYNLGYGEDKSGHLLLLSMAERDFCLIAYGYGNTAFTDYGKMKMEEWITPELGRDDWYGAFSTYLDKCDSLIGKARSGDPYDVDSTPMVKAVGTAVSAVIGLIVAWLIVAHLESSLKSVSVKTQAKEYVLKGGVTIHDRSDQFVNTTRTRRKVEKKSSGSGRSSGGTSVRSSGFSSRSGKF